MVSLGFWPPDSSPAEFVDDAAMCLLPLLFRLPPQHQAILHETFRSLIRFPWPLAKCATYCCLVLARNPEHFYAASTAVYFLKNYFRFCQYPISGEDLTISCSLILAAVTAQVTQSPQVDFAMFLGFISHCCRCLATLLSLAEDSDENLIDTVDHDILVQCWTWGLEAIASHVEDDALELVKPKTRILKAFSVSRRSLFPLLDLECLVTVCCQVLSSTTSSLLKDSLLLLLHSIMEFDPDTRNLVLTGLDARVLCAAARLTALELEEFQEVPVRYMDCCLLFSRERIPHCPRSSLLQIFQRMSRNEIDAMAERIEELGFPSEPADQEMLFFLMNCIALTGAHSLPELYTSFAESQLSSEIDPVLAATLLVCLSGVNAKKDRRPHFSAIACRYIECDSVVVRHSAVELCCRNFEITTLDVNFIWEVTTRVVQLVISDWHPHLLPILTNLLRFPFFLFRSDEDETSSFDPTPTIIDWFNQWVWPAWWFSDEDDSSAYLALLDVFLRLLPEEVVYEVASFLGSWFCNLEPLLPFGNVMSVALMVAGRLHVFPPVFFNVLPFCMDQCESDNAWIAPASEMWALLVQCPTCLQVPAVLSLLHESYAALAAFESMPRRLILAACFVQAIGPDALPLVTEAMPVFLGSDELTPVWSAALVVVVSAIIVSFVLSMDFEEFLPLGELRRWYAFGEWIPDPDHHLAFNRLSIMSIAGFLVLAMAHGDAEAFGRAIHQMATLTCDEPDAPDECWERPSLPFDAIDIVVLLANFNLDYQGERAEFVVGEQLRVSFMRPRSALQSPGFRDYLSSVNHWLP
jgi:hypothetical protein